MTYDIKPPFFWYSAYFVTDSVVVIFPCDAIYATIEDTRQDWIAPDCLWARNLSICLLNMGIFSCIFLT